MTENKPNTPIKLSMPKEMPSPALPDFSAAEPTVIHGSDAVSAMKPTKKEAGRKLFANKKANIALGILGGIIIAIIIIALI